MTLDAPDEALKAQAVAIYTFYSARRLENSGDDADFTCNSAEKADLYDRRRPRRALRRRLARCKMRGSTPSARRSPGRCFCMMGGRSSRPSLRFRPAARSRMKTCGRRTAIPTCRRGLPVRHAVRRLPLQHLYDAGRGPRSVSRRGIYGRPCRLVHRRALLRQRLRREHCALRHDALSGVAVREALGLRSASFRRLLRRRAVHLHGRSAGGTASA